MFFIDGIQFLRRFVKFIVNEQNEDNDEICDDQCIFREKIKGVNFNIVLQSKIFHFF